MLSKKFKSQLKKIAVNTAVAMSIVVVLFGMAMNLDGFVKTGKEINSVAQGSGAMGGSEVYVVKNSDGFHLDITAKDDSGIRKIEVYQDSELVQESNFGGSDNIEYADVKLNSVPFGDTETITIKVNGDVVDTQTITNTRYIATTQDLYTFRNSVNGGNTYAGQTIDLVNDIDLSSVCGDGIGNWIPIGPQGSYNNYGSISPFSGTFHGNYHKIKNIYINSNMDHFGLFGYVSGAYISGIIIESGSMISSGMRGGALIGIASNSVIEECGNKINVSCRAYSSGLIGQIWGDVRVHRCFNTGNITCTGNQDGCAAVSGLNGSNDASYTEFIDCYNTGLLYAGNGSYGGGIIGAFWSGDPSRPAKKIINCYNSGSCQSNNYNGGLTGCTNSNMTLNNSYYINEGNYTGTNNGVLSVSNVSRVSSDELKSYASRLGKERWIDDIYGINNNYPILRWQVEAAQLNARHEYMHVGDTKQLVLDTSVLPFTNDLLTWHSYDESIASVDNNGLLTAVGEGYTTIWAEYSQYNIKVMAIINVTKKGAIAVPQVTGGTNNNCSFLAVLKEDGTVWTSGANNYGQLGNGTYNDSNELVQVMIDNKTPLKNVIKISSSRYHTVALTRDGHVFTWGRNHGGQLGTADQNNRNLATCVLRKR